ncbi:MAG: PAS domain-containing methyl-accepting chemotaxis protein [Roseibium sp.]
MWMFSDKSGAGETITSANRRHLSSVVAAMSKSQAMIEFELDGTIVDANQNFLDAVGYTIDEIKGKPHSLFVDPEFATSSDYRAFWASLGEGKFQAAEFMRYGKDGRQIWIQASYNPLFNASGKPYRVIKFATDITDQKLKNADFEGQIEAIGKSQAVIEFDLDGTILTANENFLAVMGYRFDEVKGMKHAMFAPDGLPESQEYYEFWDALREGKYQSGEFQRVGKGQREIWIQAYYNPIFDPSGKPFKVVKYASDITDQVLTRRNAEKVGKQVDEKLEMIVSSVGEVSRETASAVKASDQTLSIVQAVASAIEEFESSSREIAANMSNSRDQAERAMSETLASDQSTQRLNDMAESMVSIVSVIQDIASQINLLALNATIESARAGEAGRGFAVVASEVKDLASQVASATEQIGGQITGVQTAAGEVVDRLAAIKVAAEQVQTSVSGVAGAIEEQSATTAEIAANMQSASTSVQEINTNIDTISKATKAADLYASEGTELYRSLAS